MYEKMLIGMQINHGSLELWNAVQKLLQNTITSMAGINVGFFKRQDPDWNTNSVAERELKYDVKIIWNKKFRE